MDQRGDQQQWRALPRTAWLLRALSWVVPIFVSVAVTTAAGRWVPQPERTAEVVAWWVALSAIATGVLYGVDRVTRRLLPLAALFKLSLVFPDRAPSRFRTALRTGTVHQLEARVRKVRERGLSDDTSAAAEELLELIAALSAHDRLTRGHAERVRAYSRMIGEELHLHGDDLSKLHWAGLLHDVGKLFVPTEILNKPGLLTDEEFEVVKGHPGWGAELCEPLRGWLGDWVDAVGQHHERWTGGGYPTGIAGQDISLAARIVAVADAFDVMTCARSYKQPVTPAAARDELTRCAGSQFDPDVVRAFLNVSLGRLRLVMGPLSSLAQLPVLGRVPIGPAVGGGVSALVTAATLFAGGLITVPDVGGRQVVVADRGAGDQESAAATATSIDGDAPSDEPDRAATSDSPGDVPNDAGDSPSAGSTPPGGSSPTTPPTSPPSTGPGGGDGGGSGGGGPGTTSTTTTSPPPPPPPPAAWYLRSSGSGPDDWALSSAAPPVANPEPDSDGDGLPGLTVKKGDQKLTSDDGDKYQHWNLTTGTPLRLDGVVTLRLWSTVKDFDTDKDADRSVWLLDCAASGKGCTILASTVDVHIDKWNGGVAGWAYREITVGSVSHTIAPGRMLRLRVMFNHEDIWISTSGSRASRLLIQ